MNKLAFPASQIPFRYDPALPLYLLVDPHKSIAEDWAVSLASLREILGEEALTEVPRADYAGHAPESCPRLALLTCAGEKPAPEIEQLIAASVRIARSEHPGSRRYICGWLQSAADAPALAAALAQRMLIPQPHSGGNSPEQASAADTGILTPANARFYPLHEPLRQELIAYACQTSEANAAAHTRWLDDIVRWHVPTAGGQGIIDVASSVVEHPATLQSTQAKSLPALPHIAVQAQGDAFYVANALSVWYDLAYIRPLSPAMLRQMPLLRRHQPLPQDAAWQCLLSLRVAVRCGLKNRHDLVTLAIMRILAHPRFEQHPTVIAAIRRAARGEAMLGDALAFVTEPQWMAILRELDSTV